jgi:FOG: PKD repeat
MYPLDVTFNAEVDNYAGSYLWSFGDGITSTVLNPDHTYAEAGSYTVSLQLDDETITKKEFINVKGRKITGRIVGEDDLNTGLSQYWVELFFDDEVFYNLLKTKRL